MDYKSESLVHYGIKGMKWGVRRYQNKDGSLTSAGKNRYGKDLNDLSLLTDDELSSMIRRLQMEEQYKKMNPSYVTRGKKAASSILKFGTSMAAATTAVLTIYNNIGKISKIFDHIDG